MVSSGWDRFFFQTKKHRIFYHLFLCPFHYASQLSLRVLSRSSSKATGSNLSALRDETITSVLCIKMQYFGHSVSPFCLAIFVWWWLKLPAGVMPCDCRFIDDIELDDDGGWWKGITNTDPTTLDCDKGQHIGLTVSNSNCVTYKSPSHFTLNSRNAVQ